MTFDWRKHDLVALAAKLTCLGSLLLALPSLATWLGLPPEGDAVDYRLPLVKWMVAHGRVPNWPWTFIDDYPLLGDIAMAIAYALHPNLMRLVPIFGYALIGYFSGKLLACFFPSAQKSRAFWVGAAWALGLRPLAIQANLLMVDTLASAFLVGGLYFTVSGAAARAGWLTGLSMATRYTTWPTGAFLLLCQFVCGPGPARARLWRVSLFALAAGICVLPFMARNFFLNANPVFPLATSFFNGYPLGVFDQYGRGKSLLDFALLPIDLLYTNSFVRGLYDYTVGKLFYLHVVTALGLGLWAISRGEGRRLAQAAWRFRLCLAFVAAHTVAWFLSSQQMRFLVPALVVVTVAMAGACLRLAPRGITVVVTLATLLSALSIQKDSILLAAGLRVSQFEPGWRAAEECFQRAGLEPGAVVGHLSRDGVLGFLNQEFIYAGDHSYLVPAEHGYPAPRPEYLFDARKAPKPLPGYEPWPKENPCIWRRGSGV